MRRPSAIRVVVGLVGAAIAGHDGNAGRLHQGFGARLVAHGVDRRRRRADEDEAGLGAGFGECGILGQESVARMHRVGARKLCGRQQRLNVEVALLRRRRADAHRFVGLPHMQGAGIGIAEDRNRAIAKRFRGPRDAASDLAAVGDQDFGERDHFLCP